MLKEIIFQHKKEKDKLLAKTYVFREQFEFGKKQIENDLIKIIIGPRRAGKSIFSMILLKGKEFAYLNFDDENILKITDGDEIIKGIFEVYGEQKIILFDEIQNFKNWELFANKLHRRGYNLILTGSNARLLNKELATVLTGRHIPIEILPFSFKEFLAAKNFTPPNGDIFLPETKGILLNYLGDYLINGGFPEAAVKNIDVKLYLDTFFDSVLLKDAIKRYKVRFPQKIYDLSLYLMNNYSQEASLNKLKNILNFNSVNTLEKYLNYLEETYLIFILNRYSYKMKERIKAPKKIYIVDNGLIKAKTSGFSPDSGKLMENLVFMELLKKGYAPNKSIFYYKTRNQKEVDFILKEGLDIKTLIQVSYQTLSPDARKRETKALIEAGEELKCDDLLIITWDEETEEKVNGKIIKFMPLWKWLMDVK
ncbi:ATP-binding protein [Patescibacteria group bacterium]|nr:ATP-binding protein [Patescibacteria group bacterium]